MTENGVTNWILVNYTATSLYNVIADGNYHATKAGRAEWMSLLNDAFLQPNCNKEGFNVQCSWSKRPWFPQKSRIGILGSSRGDCYLCYSVIGFGIELNNWSGTKKWKLSSGSINKQEIFSFGYIFVQ